MTESKLKARHILVTGSDEFTVKARAEEILGAIKPEDPMNLEVVDGYVDSSSAGARQVANAIESVQTLPFFGGTKVVYLKNANFLGDSQTSRGEELQGNLEKLASLLSKTPTSEVQLVISATSIDKRRNFFKEFSKYGEIELYERLDLTRERDMESWLQNVDEVLQGAGIKPGPLVVERLVDLVGSDSRSLHAEVEKLKLYSYPEGKVDEKTVREVCSGNREMVVWDLCDAITTGRVADAVQMLRVLLAQGEQEVGLLNILSGHIRLAALGRHLQETKRLKLLRKGNFVTVDVTPEGMDLLPVNKKGEKPNLFRLSKVVQQSQGKGSDKWFKAIEIVHEAHKRLFSQGVDHAQVLESTVMELCML